MACRILVPWPGIEPGPQQWKCRVLTTGLPGNSPVVLNIFTMLCNHYHSLIPEHFHHPQSKPCTSQFPSPSIPWQPICFLPLWVCLFWIFHISGIIICGPLCVASFTWPHVFEVHLCCNMSQYFITFYGWTVPHYMDRPRFVYPLSVDEHFSCFYFLGIMNNAAMTIRVQVLVWTYIFTFLGYIRKKGIVGS